MDEQELWTPSDDESIRRALGSLRWEIDALPLADVRFVKARGNSRRRRAFLVGAAVTAAAVAVGVLGFNALGRTQALDLSPAGQSSAHKGPPPDGYGNHWPTAPIVVPLPAATDPNICGRWSSLDSKPMQDLVVVHGDVRACLKIASGWMIVTARWTHSSKPGEIGIMDCHSDPACLDGRQNRDVSQFTWQSAPSGTSLSILSQNGSVFTLSNGQGQITFNSDTKKFGPGSRHPAP
jgi:hypothetical protein